MADSYTTEDMLNVSSTEPSLITNVGQDAGHKTRYVIGGFCTTLTILLFVFNTIIVRSLKYWAKLGQAMRVLLRLHAYTQFIVASVISCMIVFFFTSINSLYSCVIPLSIMFWAMHVNDSLLLMMVVTNYLNAKNIARNISQTNPASQSVKRRVKYVVYGIWTFWAGIHLWGILDVPTGSGKYTCYFIASPYLNRKYIMFVAATMLINHCWTYLNHCNTKKENARSL